MLSNCPAVVCPMQERLPLDGPANRVSLSAVFLELGNMTLLNWFHAVRKAESG